MSAPKMMPESVLHKLTVDGQPHLLDRRDLLKGMSAAVLVGAGVLRSGIGNAVSVEARIASATIGSEHELTWFPAWRLREMIVSREISAVEVVEHFLYRIEQLEPKLHAFQEVDYE